MIQVKIKWLLAPTMMFAVCTANAADKTFKVHLDGYNQTDLLSGQGPGMRNEIFYFDAGGNLNAVRYKQWKAHFTIMEGSINEAYRKTPSWPVIISLEDTSWCRTG